MNCPFQKPIKPKRSFLESGQGLVEYALIIVGVVLVVILAVTFFGEEISEVYCQVTGELGGDACAVESASYCSDEFKNNRGWEFTRSGEDSWTFEAGSMCMSKNTYKDYAFNVCSQAMPSDDYIIRVKGASLTQGAGYGVFFRLQGVSTEPSGYAFQYDKGISGFVFRKWTNGSEKTLKYKRTPDFDFYAEEHDIEIHVVGESFRAYMDGELILEANDSAYLTGSGGVGFRTWHNSRVCFEGFSVDPVSATN